MKSFFLLTTSTYHQLFYKKDPFLRSVLGDSIQIGSAVHLLAYIYLRYSQSPRPLIDNEQQLALWSKVLKKSGHSGTQYESNQYHSFYHNQCMSSFVDQANTELKPSKYDSIKLKYNNELEDYQYIDMERLITEITTMNLLNSKFEIVSTEPRLFKFLTTINAQIIVNPLPNHTANNDHHFNYHHLPTPEDEVLFAINKALLSERQYIIFIPDNYIEKGIAELLLSIQSEPDNNHQIARIINNYDNESTLTPLLSLFTLWLEVFLSSSLVLSRLINIIDSPLLCKNTEPELLRHRSKEGIVKDINFLNTDDDITSLISQRIMQELPKFYKLISESKKINRASSQTIAFYIDLSMSLISTLFDLKKPPSSDLAILVSSIRSLKKNSTIIDQLTSAQYISMLNKDLLQRLSTSKNKDKTGPLILITNDMNDLDFISPSIVCGLKNDEFPFPSDEGFTGLYSINNNQLTLDQIMSGILSSRYPSTFTTSNEPMGIPLLYLGLPSKIDSSPELTSQPSTLNLTSDTIDISTNTKSISATDLSYYSRDPIGYLLSKIFIINSHYRNFGLSPIAYGNIMHRLLEDIYTKFPSSRLIKEVIDINEVLIPMIDNRINQDLPAIQVKPFIDEFKKSVFKTLRRFISEESQNDFIVAHVEYPVTITAFKIPIIIKIDRIDKVNKLNRIIDYKFSLASKVNPERTSWWSEQHFSPQLPIYSFIFNINNIESIEAVVFEFDTFKYYKPDSVSSKLQAEWHHKITSLLDDYMNNVINLNLSQLKKLKTQHPFIYTLNTFVHEQQ